MWQDREQPDSVAKTFGGSTFNARFAAEDSSAKRLQRQPGSDGFRVNSAPLFEVSRVKCAMYISLIYLALMPMKQKLLLQL